jgi:hypothetical protein
VKWARPPTRKNSETSPNPAYLMAFFIFASSHV